MKSLADLFRERVNLGKPHRKAEDPYVQIDEAVARVIEAAETIAPAFSPGGEFLDALTELRRVLE